MARYYIIDGHKFYRRSIIKLTSKEKNDFKKSGIFFIKRSLEWPLEYRIPDLKAAYIDKGGTDIWGSGPYLKVPNRNKNKEFYDSVNRIFCPWGYPPDRVRIARSKYYVQLITVEISCKDKDNWYWLLTMLPWKPNDENGKGDTTTII